MGQKAKTSMTMAMTWH